MREGFREAAARGWKLISVTPTKKVGFGRIVQLTAIYEKEVQDGEGLSTTISAKAERLEKIKAKTERLERAKEAQKLAKEKEEAYRNSLSPEQLQQYLKRKRIKALIIAAIVLGTLILGAAITANNPATQTFSNSLFTPVPTDTPVPPTPTPDLKTTRGVETYVKQMFSNIGAANLNKVTYDPDQKSLNVYFYQETFLDNGDIKNQIENDSFDALKDIWTDNRLNGILTSVTFHLQSKLTDKYGNVSTDDVGWAKLTKDTAVKFHWDNLFWQDVWNNHVYDDQWILPSIEKG